MIRILMYFIAIAGWACWVLGICLHATIWFAAIVTHELALGMFSQWSCGVLFWVVGFIAVWTVFSCSLCGHVIFLLDIIMCFKSTHCHISILSFHITYSYTLNLAKFHYSALVVHHHQKCQQFTVTTSNLFFWQINITSSSRKGFESRCM